MDHPTGSLRIGYDPTVQQQKSWAVQISKLHSNGRITELRIHICRFDDEKGQCFGLGVCTVDRNSPGSVAKIWADQTVLDYWS